MCRWIAYTGAPARLEDIIVKPARSLVHQSLHASQCKTTTNGDGFGIGWYGDRESPGIYREISPAWSDENLLSLCAQLSARTFFAHVRASTGAATARSNCHPFSHGRWLFMHNGQIGGFRRLRRRIENMIPDAFYAQRQGGTDSEAIFLIALGRIEADGPIAAIQQTLATIHHEMLEAGIDEALRFSAALTDGERLFIFRWSSDEQAPSVYYRHRRNALIVVSEPIDDGSCGAWQAVPAGHVLEIVCGDVEADVVLRDLAAHEPSQALVPAALAAQPPGPRAPIEPAVARPTPVLA